MSFDLQKVFDENLDLYEILEFGNDMPREQLTPSAIKKQYRTLALLYHPDKQPDNPKSLHKFHLISLATHVLGDSSLRDAYNGWLRNRESHETNDKVRTAHINKLHKREADASRISNDENAPNVQQIQKYGETLRKLKHFKMSYGDWKNLRESTNSSENSQPVHKFYDSSTLRIELINDDPTVADKLTLKTFLSRLFEVQELYDLYYSSRNDFQNDETIVAYAVLMSPQEAQQLFQRWTERRNTEGWKSIIDIAPRIPLHYYAGFTDRVELNPKIAAMVNNDTIVIE